MIKRRSLLAAMTEKRFIKPASLLLLLFAVASTRATERAPAPPAPYDLSYHTEIKGIDIDGTRTLKEADDGDYLLSQTAEAMLAGVTETARFKMIDGHIQPVEFLYQRHVFGKDLTRRNVFHGSGGEISYQENDDKTVPVKTDKQPVYDPLTFQLAMRRQLIQFGKLQETHYQVVDDDRVREQEFRLGDIEWLKTDAGWLKTQVLERIHDSKDKKTLVWLAVDYDYVIARIEHRKNDKPAYVLHLKGGSVAGKAVTGPEEKPATAPADKS